ncbi:hypothetical protein D3OALGA1CA_2764 [Olavius algarvensis associated proteobacterium Delta 3]|nr:hypothetical protein D3OALGB2SA_782 [Olavius algarvensis associated proteobacterium Delta 3]CAB5123921.1 hypothetical protein D3OALGA1CA_2764 [Olavius algarvensis associated proteobacterium Delta 3]
MKKLISRLFGKERRKFQRFIVEEVTPTFTKAVQPEEAVVENISIGGICIKYSGESEITDNTFDLDITASDGFHLGNITVERKSDSITRSGPEDKRPYRRVRGRFIGVSKVQRLKLQRFLESYERKFAAE